MTRKNVSSAYFNGELWNELLEKNLTNTFKISNTSTRESVMRKLDSMRKQELYPHPDCTDECKKKVLIFSRLIYIQRHIEKDYYNISPNCMAFSKCHFYKFFNSKLNRVIFQKYFSSNCPIYLHAPIYSIHVLW